MSQNQEVTRLEQEAERATGAGRPADALRACERILQIEPQHPRALSALAKHAFVKGNIAEARELFAHLAEADSGTVQNWVNLALTCQRLQDDAGMDAAVQRALSLDPAELLALLMRANMFERQGKTHQAALTYGTIATVSPPMDKLHPELRGPVAHAMEYRENYDRECAGFIDEFLDERYRAFSGENLTRFRTSVDIMLGRKPRYDSLPSAYFFPNLAPTEFFARSEFPWLEAVEAQTDAIRDEFLNVLQTEEGFTPYLTYPDDVPHNQFAELNNSPRWSALHLIQAGKRVPANADRCPVTETMLRGVPQPEQSGRTPVALFSLLKPKTRIPPHNGVTNIRLLTHLPLIIPENCGFRVGNTTREWVPGTAWVFDDSVQHEAWNDSDKLRVILIFDVWHPHLTPPERALITSLAEALNAFNGGIAPRFDA